MQLRAAVDGLGLELACKSRVVIGQFVYAAVGSFLQPPSATEVDHTNPAGQGERRQFARLLVWGCEKQEFDAGIFDAIPVEGGDGVDV
jgi:hypothetical protein